MSDFNYLKLYCSLLKETEVPPRFAIWCGMASLLAVLERRVWINQGIYTIYPNFYMVLVAASGQKKSTAVNLTARLLRRMNPGPTVISQKITPEALIEAIQGVDTENPKSLGKIKAGGIVVADELVTFLDKNSLDKGLGPILTTLFDCQPLEYRTKKRGIERIEDAYLSLLGGSTVELLKSALPRDAIGGGFTSRTMFVYEETVPPPVPWLEFNEEHEQIERTLVDYLQRLLELEGPVRVTPQARELYIEDYKARHYNEAIRADPFLRNYENRRHAHLFKLAMAMMICEEPRLELQLDDIRRAKVILEEAESYLPRVMELLTSSDFGQLGSMVLQYITALKRPVSRSDIVRQFGHRTEASELSKVIETLILSGRLKATTDGGKLAYELTSRR